MINFNLRTLVSTSEFNSDLDFLKDCLLNSKYIEDKNCLINLLNNNFNFFKFLNIDYLIIVTKNNVDIGCFSVKIEQDYLNIKLYNLKSACSLSILQILECSVHYLITKNTDLVFNLYHTSMFYKLNIIMNNTFKNSFENIVKIEFKDFYKYKINDQYQITYE